MKAVELRRHTESEGDALTEEGIEAAVAIGARREERYDIIVSSGAQRATQTIACLLAGMGHAQPGGVKVDDRFRSEHEDRWRAAYETSGGGDLDSFRSADPDLVEQESRRFAGALRDIFAALPAGGRGLVVGHSPMQEAAVYGLSGEDVGPLSKGAGVVLIEEDGSFRIESAA